MVQSNPKSVGICHNFNKKFYKQLTLVQSIKSLLVEDKFENLDYDLFLNLPYLNSFTIYTEKLPIPFIAKVFKLKFMDYFVFDCSNCIIDCSRYSNYSLVTDFTEENTRRRGNFRTLEWFNCLDDLTKRIKILVMENKNRAYLRECLLYREKWNPYF